MERSETLALGLAGIGVFEIFKTYRACIPPISDLRETPETDTSMQLALRDADRLTGSLALIAGGVLAYQTKSAVPLVLAAVVFAVVSGWHHKVLNGEVGS